MKIVFWNTARGSSFISERLDLVMENCVGLAYCRPELIVLCEGLKGTRKQMKNKGGIPGYVPIKPSKLYGGYTDQNTLRYIIFARQDCKCVAFYCSTGDDRPAVHITICNIPVMVIHAPSVTSTYKPQRKAIKNALLSPNQMPAVIFGDFNVNAFDSGMRNNFVNTLSDDYEYLTNDSRKLIPKYDKYSYTRPKSKKALDWALVNPSFNSAVKVNVMQTQDDSDDSDDDFVPPIISTGKSDHEAILIEIT